MCLLWSFKTTSCPSSPPSSLPAHSTPSTLPSCSSPIPTTSSSSFSSIGSPTTPFSMKFPYLANVPEEERDRLEAEEKDELEARLLQESKDMEKKFAILLAKVNSQLKGKGVTMDELMFLLKNSFHKVYKAVKHCKDYNKFMLKLSDYWSFFDYEMLDVIVTSHCANLTPDMEKYKEEFKLYCTRRICEVPEGVIGIKAQDRDCLFFKCDDNFNYKKTRLWDVKVLTRKLSNIFRTKLVLRSIRKGCIELVLLSLSAMPYPLTDQHKKEVKELGIVQIYSNSREYFSVSDLQHEAVEGDTTDLIYDAIEKLDEEAFLKAIDNLLVEGSTISKKLAHCVICGPTGSGKSSLLMRLLRKRLKKFSRSTGIIESMMFVDTNEINPATFYSAAVVGSDLWKEVDYDVSLVSQIGTIVPASTQLPDSAQAKPLSEDMKPKQLGGMTLHEIFSKSAPLSYQIMDKGPASEATILSNTILQIVRQYGFEAFKEYLMAASFLYFRDIGGQVEFQEVLPLLMFGPSIFLFVFRADLDFQSKLSFQYRESADRSLNCYTSSITTEEALLQFLASVYAMDTSGHVVKMHKSLVFIVGTHIDQLGPSAVERLEQLNQHIESVIEKNGFRELVQYADEGKGNVIFPVDSTSDSDQNFCVIRSKVNSLVSHREEFTIEYPSSFLFFCLDLRKVKKPILSLNEFKALAARHGIEGEQVFALLDFLHLRVGVVRYYNVDGLRDIVVVQPQVLFNTITTLIVKTFSCEAIPSREKLEYKKKGLLSTTAFESVISMESNLFFSSPLSIPLASSFSSEEEMKRGIVSASAFETISIGGDLSPKKFLYLLVHLRIIVPLPMAEYQEEKYFIPCVLNHVPESSQEDLPHTDVSPLAVKFRCQHCPKGLFGVLVTHLMTTEPGKSEVTFSLMQDKIFKDQVFFMVHSTGDQDTISIRAYSSHLEIKFFPGSLKDRDSFVTTICQNIRKVIVASIYESLSDLHYSREKLEPFVCLRCESCSKLHRVFKGTTFHKIHCDKTRQTSSLPAQGRCWFNEGETSFGVGSLGSVVEASESRLYQIAKDTETIAESSGGVSMLTMADHYAVTRHLRALGKDELIDVGLALGLCYPHLCKMRPLLHELVAAWLNREDIVMSASGAPNWTSLIKALRDINQPALAEKIEQGQKIGNVAYDNRWSDLIVSTAIAKKNLLTEPSPGEGVSAHQALSPPPQPHKGNILSQIDGSTPLGCSHQDVLQSMISGLTPEVVATLGQTLGIGNSRLAKCSGGSIHGEMVHMWLIGADESRTLNPVPTWRGFAEALDKIGQGEIVEKIRTKLSHPGIVFCKGSVTWRLTSAAATYDGLEDIGVYFSYAANSFCSDTDVSIFVCLSGPFELPDGFESASPAYLIYPDIEFQKEVVVRMHHYARLQSEEDCEDMAFLTARSTPEYRKSGPVYVFKEVQGAKGAFRPGDQVGEIELKHFCFCRLGRKRSTGNYSYSARLYRSISSHQSEISAVFCMCLNHVKFAEHCDEMILRNYTGLSGRKETQSYSVVCILGDKVELRVKELAGVSIHFDKTPQILKREIHMIDDSASVSDDYPPRLAIYVQSGSPTTTLPELHVLGVDTECRFYQIPVITPLTAISQQQTSRRMAAGAASLPCDRSSSNSIPSPISIGSGDVQSPGEIVVRSEDVNFLMTYLHKDAYKWREIGSSLNFLHGELENISHSNPRATMPQLLTILLNEWSQRRMSDHYGYPTMEKLHDALRSNQVNLGVVADDLYAQRNSLPSRKVS